VLLAWPMYIYNWSIVLEFHFHIGTVARVLQTYNVNWTILIQIIAKHLVIMCRVKCQETIL
jgi:hypothetical protein